MIDATATIKWNVHTRLNTTINFVASALHVECSNWRMVTDLFKEDWAAIQPTLIGLTQDRIERFVHFET